MSLDIIYRPINYGDVLGQEATIAILKQYVIQGKGFQQSYLFCGGHGSGKTTLGRILARALLCENPVEGEPCNKCVSCRSLLEGGTSVDFMEVDAATKSGKADIDRIKDEIQYATFSGKRRIYLFDESHRLSKEAIDALLKPMEDNFSGSNDKQLTCIFCTTEPEKMKVTVLSRCAPAFVIQPQKPKHIAGRLQHICEQEKIEFEPDMLVLISEITECHIRDAIKAVEGVSMLGGVAKEHVQAYLHLDLNAAYLDLIGAIGTDLPAAFAAARKIMERASPLTCYERLAEVSMLAFRASLGESAPAHWGKERLAEIGRAKGAALLGYAARFASRPGRPTAPMLMVDIAHLHHVGGSVQNPAAVIQVHSIGGPPAPVPQELPLAVAAHLPLSASPPPPTPATVATPAQAVLEPTLVSGSIPERDALWVEATQGPAATKRIVTAEPADRSNRSTALKPAQFANLLNRTLLDLASGGSA